MKQMTRTGASVGVAGRGELGPQVGRTVDRARSIAVKMMAVAGFKIASNVKVAVDPQLPFMGYTMPRGDGFTIVVSGGAVGSEMLEGLLVHEMSHIYRIQTKHPSHNAEILEGAISGLGNIALRHDYQQKIVHDLLNDIQDMYADDISFKVFRTTPTAISDQITGFLQSWVNPTPANSDDPRRDQWINAWNMAHNARAIAQMKRHRIEDTGDKATQANQTFLDGVSPEISTPFDYFENQLENLKEDVTENEYKAFLAEYLHRFIEITEKD